MLDIIWPKWGTVLFNQVFKTLIFLQLPSQYMPRCLFYIPTMLFFWSRGKWKRVIQLWDCSYRIRSPLLFLLPWNPKQMMYYCVFILVTQRISCPQQNTSAEMISSFQYVRGKSLYFVSSAFAFRGKDNKQFLQLCYSFSQLSQASFFWGFTFWAWWSWSTCCWTGEPPKEIQKPRDRYLIEKLQLAYLVRNILTTF